MKPTRITSSNYFDTIKKIGFENLPLVLKQSHTVILTKTVNGGDWSKYKNDPDLKRMIDLAFKKLEEFIESDSDKQIKGLEGMKEKQEKEKTKRENAYSDISTEIRFINRFLDFNDKILYKKTFEIFIDELQQAIKNKQITKKSPVAKDIMEIQKAVLNAFNTMKNAKHFVLKPTTVKRLKTIIEKYENAYDDLDDDYLNMKKRPMDLSGINRPSIKIETQTPQTPINLMKSTDFVNMKFNTLGFKDKWLEFIGDPSRGFTVMVFGMPKMGKSYLCVDFAGYLARNHGKVLYVAKEEKLDRTLQDKLNDKNVAHENLTVADGVPTDLSCYDFIFLDSVNKLKLSPDDLEKLKTNNKGKSFIYVFQATKGGQFKGNNEFQHDVDVVIEIPEIGKAVQHGRFNQGGEMDIFPEDNNTEREKDANLSGISKRNSKRKYPAWTAPKFMDARDHERLRYIYDLYTEGRFEDAMDYARNVGDTAIREEIPPDIWVAIGGKLTTTGEEKLAKQRKLLSRKSSQATITTELGMSLEELAIELIPKKQPKEDILHLIDNKRSEVESRVTKMVEDAVKEEGVSVDIVSVKFNHTDSTRISTGAAYFKAVLKGAKKELKQIAGEDKLFYYEW